MKNRTILYKASIVIILFFTASTTFSQGLRLGFIASPQVSWIKSDINKVKTDGNLFGFDFGLNADFFFTKNYALSTGITINNVGGKLNYSDPVSLQASDSLYNFAGGTSITYKLQYLKFPLSVKLKTNQIGYFTYYGQFGLTPKILIGAKADVSSYSINEVNIIDEINFFNLSYNVGGGIEYSLGGNTAITVGVIYTNGFIDVTKNENNAKDKTVVNSVTCKLGIMF
ncbi:MAG: PorT family protein [Bacteroidetes bacterium]|nr:MAG: PorT family protein [Bacteroidota bacterium]